MVEMKVTVDAFVYPRMSYADMSADLVRDGVFVRLLNGKQAIEKLTLHPPFFTTGELVCVG